MSQGEMGIGEEGLRNPSRWRILWGAVARRGTVLRRLNLAKRRRWIRAPRTWLVLVSAGGFAAVTLGIPGARDMEFAAPLLMAAWFAFTSLLYRWGGVPAVGITLALVLAAGAALALGNPRPIP